MSKVEVNGLCEYGVILTIIWFLPNICLITDMK